MASNSGVVGVLRALLTADTSQFDTSMRKAATTTDQTTRRISGLGKEVQKLTPQAERMFRAFSGERQLTAANNLAAAIARVGGATKLTADQQARANTQLQSAIDKYKALGLQAPKAVLDAEKATSTLSGKVSGLLSGLGPMAPAVAAAFSATAVIGFVKAVSDSADSLVKLSDRTGISLQGLQRLQRAGDDAGNSLDDVSAAINQMQRRMADSKSGDAFSKALDRLGLSAKELRQLDPAAQFMAMGDALRAITDPNERVSLANALGGRQFIAVLPTLTRGFDDLRDHIVGMSDDAIHSLDDAGDAAKSLSRRVLDAGGEILAGAIDFMFPFKAAVRDAQALNDQLDRQIKDRQGRVPGLIGPPALNVPTMSLEDADRIAKELDDKTKQLIADEQKLADVMARAFGLDKIDNARELVKAIGGLQGVARMDREQVAALNKLMDDAIGAAKRNGRDVPLEWFRILEATRDNVGSLQEYLKTVQELPAAFREIPPPPELIPFTSELDIERTRKLLAMNTPGSGPLHHAAEQVGESVGASIREGIGREFEQVPHFLISSVLHSGGFKNGLKALGVSMADAIVEPLIKQFGAKMAAARVGSALASAAGLGAGAAAIGGTAAAAGTVAAEVGATAAATTAAVSGGAGAGAAAAGAGGLGATAAALATNPFTIAAAAGIAAVIAFRHFHHSTNDKRDKFLAQFAGFDPPWKREQSKHPGPGDDPNPPGFFGLDVYLTKYKHHDWFKALVGARDDKALKLNESLIAAFVGSQGRPIKMFNLGGFVPPGVVQPAILHGGAYGETITPNGPRGMEGGRGVSINIYWTSHSIDEKGIREFVESGEFTHHLGNAFERNWNYLTTKLRKAL